MHLHKDKKTLARDNLLGNQNLQDVSNFKSKNNTN